MQAETMIRLSGIFVLVITASLSCAIKRQGNLDRICDCCDQTYSDLKTANNCILNNPLVTTTSDNRLFLFAFVNMNLMGNQDAGWNIINDHEIIKVAQRNYLLITLDANNIEEAEIQGSKELLDVIEKYDDELFFVITNQALYPFSDWTIREDKKIIIDRLEIGNGP